MLTDRTHFARLHDRTQVEQSIAMLAAITDVPIDDLTKGRLDDGFVQVFAPDGDCVFTALEKAPNVWACRFHREVFEE